jgi:hypothetical protein
MSFIPVKYIPCTVEMEVATVSVTRGDAMYLSSAGHVTTTSTEAAHTSALPVSFVSAITEDFSASANFPQTLASSRKCLCYPADSHTVWEATASSAATPVLTDLDETHAVSQTYVNAGATGEFIIEELVGRDGSATSATNLRVLGRFISKKYGNNQI